MALINYKVTLVAKQDSPFNVLPDTDISIRKVSDNALVNIFSDAAGLVPIPQLGAKSDALGQFNFYTDSAVDVKAVWTDGVNTYSEPFIGNEHNRLSGLNAAGGHDAIYPRNFNSVTNAVLGIDASGQTIDMSQMIGKKIFCHDYYGGASPSNSGVLFFEVVAFGTGTADGGRYINGAGSAFQLKQNLEFPYKVKAWGASPSAAGSVNDIALNAIMNFSIAQRLSGQLANVFDLGGSYYNINNPFVIRTSGFTLQNGTLNQTQNTRDCMQTDGDLASGGTITYLTLLNVTLNITGTANQFSGSNFRHLSGTLGWFKWEGIHTSMNGGQYGIANGYGTVGGVGGKDGGESWEMRIKRVWFVATYSSVVFWPSSGGVFSSSSGLGGTTTMKLENLAVAFITSQAPAFRIGNNTSHVIMENCSADSCTKFGEFLVATLIINNCSMELIRAPLDPTLNAAFYAAPTHDLIFVGNQQNFHVNGFTTAFDSLLSANPHPDTRAISTNGGASYIEGLIGGMVSGGKPVVVSTGYCEIKGISMPNAAPSIAINNGVIHDVGRSRRAGTTPQTGTFDLWTIAPDGLSRAYMVTTLHSFGGNSSINTLIVHTSGQSGSIQGNATNILPGIFASPVSIAIVGGKVRATVSGATFVTWSAVELTAL